MNRNTVYISPFGPKSHPTISTFLIPLGLSIFSNILAILGLTSDKRLITSGVIRSIGCLPRSGNLGLKSGLNKVSIV